VICVSLTESDAKGMITALSGLDFAEVRIDALRSPSLGDIRRIFSAHKNLVATMRPGRDSDEQRAKTLETAVEAGAAYVDVELEMKAALRDEIVQKARDKGCKVIISYHNFETTPDLPSLREIIDSCFEAKADIAKIACTVSEMRHNARLLALLDDDRPVVVTGMGKLGKITRIAAPLLGSPFTFASMAGKKKSAEGQIDSDTLKKSIEEVKRVAG